jgi:UDP-N-acetylglucosamine 2-epimerase
MRILVAFGTRPEIIKLGPVCRALQHSGIELDVFWSGQHVELAAGLLDLFGIAVTHNGFNVVTEPGLAGKIGLMTSQTEKLLKAKHYDWIIVQGDTATAAAAATAGFMNRVPVAHVEAGLRTATSIPPGRRSSTGAWSVLPPPCIFRQPRARATISCARAFPPIAS